MFFFTELLRVAHGKILGPGQVEGHLGPPGFAAHLDVEINQPLKVKGENPSSLVHRQTAVPRPLSQGFEDGGQFGGVNSSVIFEGVFHILSLSAGEPGLASARDSAHLRQCSSHLSLCSSVN